MTTRVAYLVSRYPDVTHTFILREVEALRAEGVDVDTFSVRRGRALSDADRRELAATTVLLPASPLALAGAAATALRHAGATWATARHAIRCAGADPRAVLWQLFYVVEALLLFRHLRRRRIRHVHAHFANVGADVARLCSRFGTAATDEAWTWSFTMHGPTEFADVQRYGLAAKAAEADLVSCISDYCRSQLMALTPADAWDRFEVVHCGIDTTLFSPPTRERPVDAPLEVLCVGQIVARKGQEVLLEAAALLRQRGIDVHVTLVGDGPGRAAVEATADPRHVTLTGSMGQDDIRAWYDRADVFCLPSFAEGVPVVLMEAMATGLPVVSTAIAGVPELVEHGRSGLLVRPGRADLLADALAELAADPERRRRMGQHGRAKVLEEFEIGPNARLLARQLARF